MCCKGQTTNTCSCWTTSNTGTNLPCNLLTGTKLGDPSNSNRSLHHSSTGAPNKCREGWDCNQRTTATCKRQQTDFPLTLMICSIKNSMTPGLRSPSLVPFFLPKHTTLQEYVMTCLHLLCLSHIILQNICKKHIYWNGQ